MSIFSSLPESFSFKSLPWKWIIPVGIGMIIFLFLLIFLVRVMENREETVREEIRLERVQAELQKELTTCEKEDNPQGCRNQKIIQTAQEVGAAQVCAQLEDNLFQQCVREVAMKGKNAQACETLSETLQEQSCKDAVHWFLAMQNTDLAACDLLSESAQTVCRQTLSVQIARTKGCEGTGVDPSVCAKEEAFVEAVQTGDPEACLNLEGEEDQIDCLDTQKDFIFLDTDQDGLSDQEEKELYGTDPFARDSDSDGFSDAQEIQSGYNPLGEGKLN